VGAGAGHQGGVLADLKARAAANPLAVAALAKWRGGSSTVPRDCNAARWLGLGRLAAHLPSPADYANAEDFFDPHRWPSRASAMADAAKQKVQDWGAQASDAGRDAARDAKAQIAETTASVTEHTSDALRNAGDTAREQLRDTDERARARMMRFADDASSMSDQASARLRASMPDREDRDNILLGAAALAVAAAVGIAVQRRTHQEM
jgi:gas vesicle protein